MHLRKSDETAEELRTAGQLDWQLGVSLEACIEMLKVEVNEFEGHDGFSIKRVGGLFRRGIRVSRVKYEKYIPGKRILFFPISSRDCVFVTGIHAREELGRDYDFSRGPFIRAIRYWGMRETLC